MLAIIDYLEFKIEGLLKIDKIGDYKRIGSTNGYRHILDIDNYIIQSDSYGFVGKNKHKVKVKNHLLYSSDIMFHVEQLQKFFLIEKIYITRIDYAFDFQNEALLKKLVNIITAKMVKHVQDYTVIGKNAKDIETYYCGKRNAKIFIRLYNKYKELQKSKKEYIQDYLTKNSIDINSEHWRLEFQIRKNLTVENAIELQKFDYPNYYFSITEKIVKPRYIDISKEKNDLSITEIKRTLNMLEKLQKHYGIDNIDINDVKSIYVKKLK